MEHSPKPLAGLKVVELGTLIAGPFASRICAEFGAEVIKIESPDGGDPLRKWRKLYEGTSLWWFVQARNKKSLTLNLKHAEGQAILKRLLGDADILIENFRPGVLEKLGQGTVVYRRLHGVDDESVRQLAHLVPDFLDLPAAGQELLNQFVQLLGLLPLYVSITPRWIAGR